MRTITPMIVRRVATIDENKSILDAAILMTQEFIGSVVITNSSGISGLFTERELVMKVVGKRKDPETVKIKDVMTSPSQRYGKLLPRSDEGTQMPASFGL
jgi:CBS domain-containing protein